MAASGTYTFASSLEVVDVFTEILERCGIFGDRVQPVHLDSAKRSINLLLGEWENDGPTLYTIEQITQALTASDADYTLAAKVVEIVGQPLIRDADDSNRETPVTLISRSEYYSFSDKTTTGKPSLIYLERVNPPVLYTYPVADESSRYTLILPCLRSAQDVTALTETPEAPKRWLEAIIAGAAAKMAVKWAPQRLPFLSGEATGAYRLARNADTERVPFRVTIG
jgi:hypothetical protein